MVILSINREKTLLATLLALINSTRIYIFITLFYALINNIIKWFRANKLEVIK